MSWLSKIYANGFETADAGTRAHAQVPAFASEHQFMQTPCVLQAPSPRVAVFQQNFHVPFTFGS